MIQTSQDIHEQELIAKGNDLRRVRDGFPARFFCTAETQLTS